MILCNSVNGWQSPFTHYKLYHHTLLRDRWSRQDGLVCTTREQFKQFDLMFTTFMITEIDEIERMTSCLKPCAYKEYKFMNSNPKEMLKASWGHQCIGKTYQNFERLVLF